MNITHKNILTLFDVTGYNAVSVQTVIGLAVTSQSSLNALYIEDLNLLNAIELPFAREIFLHTAEIKSIDSGLMVQRLNSCTKNIRQQIEKIARPKNIPVTFKTICGNKFQAIKDYGTKSHMVFIPALYTGGHTVHQHAGTQTAIIYDEQCGTSDTALNIALSYASNNCSELFVIANSLRAKRQVEHLIKQQHSVSAQVTVHMGLSEVFHLFNTHAPDLLIVPEGCQLVSNEKILQRLIGFPRSDILLVR